MANIYDAIIQQLNSEIKKVSAYRQKNRSELTQLDKILFRSANDTLYRLFVELFSTLDIQDGEKFIKISNTAIRIDTISDILVQEKIKFDLKDDKVIVKYEGNELGNLVIIFEFQIVNGWISCRSYPLQVRVKQDKMQDALILLNIYNASTRHTKACLLDDMSILLVRNDNADFIWDKNNLRDILLIDILIMLDFYKHNQEKLKEYIEPSNEKNNTVQLI